MIRSFYCERLLRVGFEMSGTERMVVWERISNRHIDGKGGFRMVRTHVCLWTAAGRQRVEQWSAVVEGAKQANEPVGEIE